MSQEHIMHRKMSKTGQAVTNLRNIIHGSKSVFNLTTKLTAMCLFVLDSG